MGKIKPRLIETIDGIQGGFNVTIYDQMQRRLSAKARHIDHFWPVRF